MTCNHSQLEATEWDNIQKEWDKTERLECDHIEHLAQQKEAKRLTELRKKQKQEKERKGRLKQMEKDAKKSYVINLQRFKSLFNRAQPDTLHIYSAVVFNKFHDFQGIPIEPSLLSVIEPKVSLSPRIKYYATFDFPIDYRFHAYIIREGDVINPKENCVRMHIFDTKKQQFSSIHTLGSQSKEIVIDKKLQTWLVYLNQDSIPDLVQRFRVIHTVGKNDDILLGKVWNKGSYISYDLSDAENLYRDIYEIKNN